MKKKILAFVLGIVVGLTGLLVGCGDNGGSDSGSGSGTSVYNVAGNNKTNIKVVNFGGGIGHEWIDEAAERFAKLNAETSYASGKKGVYIKIDNTFNENTSTMASSAYNIYFDERQSNVTELAQSGVLLNIDEIVKDETRTGGTLESKIFSSAKGGLQGTDGSYYGLPHYEYYGGLSFNKEIFDDCLAYFADDSENGELFETDYSNEDVYFVKELTSKKSAGPDGEYDTDDDGLPCSLEELIVLCDYIKDYSNGNISPVTISGTYNRYYDYLVSGLWANLAGAEQMQNYYNCTGKIEVVKRDENGNFMYTDEDLFPGISYLKKPVTEIIDMKEDGSQGNYGNDMVAKYYAMCFVEILKNEDFLSKNSNGSTSHYEAQMDLFMDGIGTTNKSAMLIEGSYWFNEASEVGGLSKYEKLVGKKRSELDVEWMALPTSYYTAGAEGREATLLDIGQAYCMINGNIANNDEIRQACIDFVKFLYSEEELATFTYKTGMPRMISYSLTNEQTESLSKFYQSFLNMRDWDGSNVVGLSGTTSTFKQARGTIAIKLDAGIFKNGSNYFWQLFTKTQHADYSFSACSLKTWSYSNK